MLGVPFAGAGLLFTALLSCGSQLGQGLIMQPLASQHHHCILGVKKSLDLSLASLESTEVFHIVTKWMNYEVYIHIAINSFC